MNTQAVGSDKTITESLKLCKTQKSLSENLDNIERCHKLRLQ